MSSLMRWDPFDEMRAMRRRMDRLFDDVLRGPRLLPWESAEMGSRWTCARRTIRWW